MSAPRQDEIEAYPEICFDRVGEAGRDVEKAGETISGHGEDDS